MHGESIPFRDFASTWRAALLHGNLVVLPVLAGTALLASNHLLFSALGPGASAERLATLGALVLVIGECRTCPRSSAWWRRARNWSPPEPSEDRQSRPQPGSDARNRRDAQDPAYPVWFRPADRVAAYAPNLAGWAMGTTAIWLLGGRVAATVFLGAGTMQIDPEVEAHLREAYSAVIGRDGDRMAAAFTGLDVTQSEEALSLALFVVAYIARDVYRHGPTDDDLIVLANQVAGSETNWVRIDRAQVAELLRVALIGESPRAVLPPNDVAPLAVVVGGHLLGAFSLDGQSWWQYLEDIWDALLAAPDPQ